MNDAVAERAALLFREQRHSVFQRTDRLFATLMLLQFVAAVGVAIWVSPLTWSGLDSRVHPHVWAAIFLGGIITSFPVWLAFRHTGTGLTRHSIAVGQMLMSALLIHLTGGRIETHFHVFGSLAILAFYRDWQVLISASLVVALDHIFRGLYWPESVYGVAVENQWRWLEHTWWVAFEVTFLCIFLRQSVNEMAGLARRQAELELTNSRMEKEINERRLAESIVHEQAALLDKARDAIVVYDPDHRIISLASHS